MGVLYLIAIPPRWIARGLHWRSSSPQAPPSTASSAQSFRKRNDGSRKACLVVGLGGATSILEPGHQGRSRQACRWARVVGIATGFAIGLVESAPERSLALCQPPGRFRAHAFLLYKHSRTMAAQQSGRHLPVQGSFVSCAACGSRRQRVRGFSSGARRNLRRR